MTTCEETSQVEGISTCEPADPIEVRAREAVDTSDATTAAAKLFGMPSEWARYHTSGRHICLDGRTYNASCLVTDAECEEIARHHLTRNAEKG